MFGVVYRCHENFQAFLNEFEDALAVVLHMAEDFFCVGDFNIDAMNFNSPYFLRFADVLESLALVQVIAEPTRVTNNSATLIDYIITNSDTLVGSSGVQPVDDISDHYLVYCTYELPGDIDITNKRTYRDYRNFNNDIFLTDLYSIPWFYIFDINDIDQKVEFLTSNLIALFDMHAPFVTRTFTRPYKPWITENMKLLIKRKKDAFKKCQRTKSIDDINDYKAVRNFTTFATNHEKKVYLNITLRDKKPHEIWAQLKKCDIYNKKKNIAVPPDLSDVNDINDYFLSVQNYDFADQEFLNYYHDNIRPNIASSFEFYEITEADVAKAIASLSSEAVGDDGIALKMIKLSCPFMLDYLRHIFNSCISSNYFPLSWKRTLVIPISKKNSPSTYSDLRPINIITVLSKILEKIMSLQLSKHLQSNNILPDHQSGFRPGYGCPAALLNITDDIIAAVDSGNLVAMVLLDYSKAFDTINHTMLLAILHHIGLGSGSVAFMRSYLSDRMQLVSLNGAVSRPGPMVSGVPQGSILGPILFSIYTSSLYDTIRHCKYHIYADDTQLYISISPSKFHESVQKLNEDLQSLSEISNKHGLSLNPSKCKVLLFGNRLTRSQMEPFLEVYLGGGKLPLCNSAKNLGLVIDSDLRYKKHINFLLQRSHCALKMIYSHRNVLDQKTKIMLCESLVLSHFNYCDVVYNNCIDAVDKKRIQRVQNSCLRFIWGVRGRERVSHLVRRTGWLNMAERRSFHALCFYHKILTTRTPPYLYNRIRFRTDVHNINIRKKDEITIPKHKLEFFKRSFSYCIAKFYNCVPRYLKSKSYFPFKCQLKLLILQNSLIV